MKSGQRDIQTSDRGVRFGGPQTVGIGRNGAFGAVGELDFGGVFANRFDNLGYRIADGGLPGRCGELRFSCGEFTANQPRKKDCLWRAGDFWRGVNVLPVLPKRRRRGIIVATNIQPNLERRQARHIPEYLSPVTKK